MVLKARERTIPRPRNKEGRRNKRWAFQKSRNTRGRVQGEPSGARRSGSELRAQAGNKACICAESANANLSYPQTQLTHPYYAHMVWYVIP